MRMYSIQPRNLEMIEIVGPQVASSPISTAGTAPAPDPLIKIVEMLRISLT